MYFTPERPPCRGPDCPWSSSVRNWPLNELKNMNELYDKNAFGCSRITANNYSMSFSFGIKLFKRKYRPAIYAIYGFVRFADEIVDAFHDQDKKELLNKLREDTWQAIE